jgi:hypothetical protein
VGCAGVAALMDSFEREAEVSVCIGNIARYTGPSRADGGASTARN